MKLVTIEGPHHEVLRQRAAVMTFPLDDESRDFIRRLREFFANLESPLGKPAGLAAPQLGVSKSIVIIQVPPEAKTIRKDVYDIVPPTVLINPSYTPIESEGKTKDWEGCYSVSDTMGEVFRYTAIRYDAYTPEGKKISRVARGFLARLIQHEVGHLNGELFIDLLCPDCRSGPMDQMMEIRKREMKT